VDNLYAHVHHTYRCLLYICIGIECMYFVARASVEQESNSEAGCHVSTGTLCNSRTASSRERTSISGFH
jgi:hypothetical protein